VGVLLARGPLDYDVPVTVRCGACGNVYETTLGEMGACPHCRRIAA
jgi:Zn finger protein HypA/HybF involved in hydrogenase expression